jgi:integrase
MKTKSHTYRGRGEGSIYQLSNGRWRAMLSLSGGSRRSAVFKNKTECKQWLQQQCFEPQSAPPTSAPLTLGEYLHSWFRTHQTGLKPSTIMDYRRILEKTILPAIGTLALTNLRRSTFDSFYTDLVEQGTGKTLVHYTHRVLHKALADAVDDRLLGYNPAHKAKLPRLERIKHHRSPLTVDQVNQLVQTSLPTPIGPLLFLAVKTGMRKGELLALQWEDIDWKERQIHVRRNLTLVEEAGKTALRFSTPKSHAGNRIINVGEATMHILERQLEAIGTMCRLAGDRWQEYQLVFPSSVGTPQHNSNLLKRYRIMLEAAGLPKITFHALRHVAASLMLNHGVPTLVVSYILGHAQPSTTMNLYGHEFSLQEIQAAEMMDQIVPLMEQSQLQPSIAESLFVAN